MLIRGRTHSSAQVLLLFLLLLRSRLLCRGLLRSSLFLRRTLGRLRFRRRHLGLWLLRLHLLWLRFFLGQFRSLKALPAKSDFRDAHRCVRLPVPAQLLVLLLALVVEHEDLRAAALFNHLADHARIRLLAGLAGLNLACFAGNRQHGELDLTVSAGDYFLHSNYISGRHPVLLSTGADDRVHTSASVKCR